MSDHVSIRPYTERDRDFVLSSWIRSFRKSSFAHHVPNDLYFEGHKRLILPLLRPDSILIASNPEDPDQILGWICAETRGEASVFHYLYVKQPFRRLGIARQLFLAAVKGPFVYTHRMGPLEKLSTQGSYSPYALFEVNR